MKERSIVLNSEDREDSIKIKVIIDDKKARLQIIKCEGQRVITETSYREEKWPLGYCVYEDLFKCFDSTNRKLLRLGIR